jgi:hypothetical protein
MPEPDALPKMPHAATLLERWLVAHLLAPPANDPPTLPLPSHTAAERLKILQQLLDQRPALARAASRLSIYDQLCLSLKLLGSASGPITPRAGLVPAWSAVRSLGASSLCFASPAGNQRRPRTC